LGYAGKNENDSPEAEPDAPHGRSRINFRRIAHRLAQFALGDLVEQILAPWLAPMTGVAAESVEAVHRVAVPEPAFNFSDALLDSRIADVGFGDPIRFDFQLEDIRAGEDERVMPGAEIAPLFVAKIWPPFFGQAQSFPLADGDFTERLLDLDEPSPPSAIALVAEVGRIAELHGADDLTERDQHVFVGALFSFRSEDVEATPAALNWLVERDTNVAPTPEIAQLAAESEEMFVEVVLCVEHDAIGGC